MVPPPFDLVAVGSWTNFDHLLEVDTLPTVGETVRIRTPIHTVEQIHFGGCAPNVAVTAKRLGVTAALVSVVGEDFRTRGYSAHLEKQGVDQSAMQVIPNELCGHSFLFRDGDGNSVCLSQIGVAERQDEFKPDPAIFNRAKVAVVTYRFDGFTRRAAELARAGGALVLLSGALATAPQMAATFLRSADFLICTTEELRQLTHLLHCNDASVLLNWGLQAVIDTHGADGACLLTKEGCEQVQAIAAPRVVDPTGAGDAFAAGVAVGLAQGLSLASAAQLGASVASFVVEAIGCQTNLPSMQQAQARIAQNLLRNQ